jgi:hypothetical protein
MNKHMAGLFKKLYLSEAGFALVEFAMILPVLLALALPLFNYIQYIMLVQKLDKTTSTIADMISMSVPATADTTAADAIANQLILSNSSLLLILNSTSALMQPFAFSPTPNLACNAPTMVVDSVYKPTGASPGIVWSVEYKGKGSVPLINHHATPLAAPSSLTAAFINGIKDEENAIVVTTSCQFTPVIPMIDFFGIPMLGTTTASSRYVFPARNGPLTFVF